VQKKQSNIGSDKSFGIVFAIFFTIISLWPIFSGENIRVWAIIIALIFLLISFIKPELLNGLNKIWSKFGMLLGKIISPIVMAFVFFAIITPMAFFMRLIGKDLLNKKITKSIKSYWIKRSQMIGTMKNQF